MTIFDLTGHRFLGLADRLGHRAVIQQILVIGSEHLKSLLLLIAYCRGLGQQLSGVAVHSTHIGQLLLHAIFQIALRGLVHPIKVQLMRAILAN